MAISEIHHVALTVANLDKSIAFYTEVLGFHKTLDMPLEGTITEKLLKLKPGTVGRSVILPHGESIVGENEPIAYDPPAANKNGPIRPGDLGVILLSIEFTSARRQPTNEHLKREG